EEGKLIVKEMTDLLCLDLVDKNLITKSITLHVGYSSSYEMKSAHGTTTLPVETNADNIMIPAVEQLYERIVNKNIPIRRVNISCNHVLTEECRQYSFFDDYADLERNRKIQKAVVSLKKKYGKNIILKGMNFEKGATTMDR